MILRLEFPGDEAAIGALTAAAFAGQAHSDGSEPAIVERLRANRELALSLVADDAGKIIGHVAFSPVTISDGTTDWFGLGPVSVEPARQGEGIGSALIERGVLLVREAGARGIVLLGDPAFYARFDFAHDPQLAYPGLPPEYFQRLMLAGAAPTGIVSYSPAFG